MKFLVLAVLTIAASAQAGWDLSQLTPKHMVVRPDRLPEVLPRIVGGDEAEHHQFKYQVAVRIDGRSFCGGSIIRKNVVLTAAHCADGARSIEIIAGAHNIQQSESTQQSITSTNFIVHEDWDANNIANDVALVILPEDIDLDGETTEAIELDDGDNTHDGENATVSGWGRPSDSSGSISPVLRHTSDKIISNSVCKGYFSIIRDSNICMNGSNGRSSCNGDSGGPLVIGGKEVGIVSFGSGWGCSVGFPSAYARVSSFKSWIDAHLP